MPEQTAAQGSYNISDPNGTYLTDHNGHAAVGPAAQKLWSLEVHGISEGPSAGPPYIFVFHGPDSKDRVLTLDQDPKNKDVVDILLEELESPPSKNQLWTLEDSVSYTGDNVAQSEPSAATSLGGEQPASSFPSISARIQSVAKPELSATVGGEVDASGLYRYVVAVPNDTKPQKWKLDYFFQD